MYSMTGSVLTRGKEELYAPVGGFKTRNGWVGLIVPGEDMWARFCNAIGRPDLIQHPLCYKTTVRVANYKSFLKPIVDEWMAAHTHEEVVDILLAHGVPAGIVQLHQGEILACENLGLCARGEGGRWVEEGVTALGGKLPVNPSGGRLSLGHSLGATGVAQVAELTWHLQGRAGAWQVEGVKVSLAHVVGASRPALARAPAPSTS